MKEQTIFTSATSLSDAQMKARMAGYQVIGSSTKSGQFIVFARPLNVARML